MTTRFCVAPLVFVMLLTPVLAEGEAEDLGPALDRAVLGDPEGAVRLALELTRENPANLKAWFLCGMLRFQELAEYAAAVECLDRVVDLVQLGGVEFPEVRHVYRSRGMSHYLLGDYAKAETDLRTGIELEPDGVHGHLLWYLAAGNAGQDGESLLRKYAGAHESGDWPYPLVALYLGDVTTEDCLGAAVVDDARTTRGNLCEAHYYLGELYLLQGDETRAEQQFEKVMQTGMEKYNEYRMAQAALEKLADRGSISPTQGHGH